MLDWFNTITTFEKIFWYFAIPFSLVFIIQLVLSIAGFDGQESNKDTNKADREEDPQQKVPVNRARAGLVSLGLLFFSLRNSIVFLMVFGWAGIGLLHLGLPQNRIIWVSFVAGFISIIIFSILFYWYHKSKKQL